MLLIFVSFIQLSFADSESYKLGAGDKINILTYGQDSLSLKGVSIGESGTIVFPFIGEIKVMGMTTVKLEKKIKNFLKGDYLIDPNVHVYIEEYRPFYIQGEVNKPGGYPYQPGLTVNRAISLGGGFTEHAAKGNVFVSHSDTPDVRKRVKLHYKLKPGDVITVEETFF